MLANVLIQRGRHDEARAQLQWLEDEHTRRPDDEDVAVALAGVLSVHGDWRRSRDLLRRLTLQFPQSSEVWRRDGDLAFQAGEPEGARAAFERALELAAPKDVAAIHCQLSQAIARTDARSSLEHLVTFFVMTGDECGTRRWLHQYSRELLDDVLRTMALERPIRHRLGLLHRSAMDPGTTVSDVLASHLEQIVARVRRAGCVPVLVGYPHRGSLGEVFERVAARTGVRLVDVAAEFARRPGDDLFIADGHCNDAGYGVMAAAIAKRIAAVIGSQ